MEKPILVSIITPSYNQAQFLEETIHSVLMQDYPSIEYLIIDGDSKDGSQAIIEKYANQLAYWVSEPDHGQSHAIQKGFGQSHGDILCWLNSDDVYLTRTVIGEMVELFNKYPQVDVITGGGVFIDQNAKWIRQMQVTPAYTNYDYIRYRPILIQPSTFFRRKVLDTTILDDSLHFTFDWDFWLQLSQGYNILVVPNVWSGYRWWDLNKTARNPVERTKEQAEIAKRYLGKRSWQYFVLFSFYLILKCAESQPQIIRRPIRKFIRWLSRLLNQVSLGRIARV